jgi:hypothetical protein
MSSRAGWKLEYYTKELGEQCKDFDGEVEFYCRGLTNECMEKFAQALLKVFDKGSPLTLKNLNLGGNIFDERGLVALAEALRRLPRCRLTLKELNLSDNENITTLAPLGAAGVFRALEVLEVWGCSFSVIRSFLCAKFPKLEVLDLRNNQGDTTLTAEALCALPADCKVALGASRVEVARNGGNGPVALPTAPGEEFGGSYAIDGKTAAEISAFAGVKRMKYVIADSDKNKLISFYSFESLVASPYYSPKLPFIVSFS